MHVKLCRRVKIFACLIAALLQPALMAAGVGAARGQNYPNKPLRIVTGSAGGGNDVMARLMVPGFSAALGQPVIIENRAQGIVAADVGAKAPPDGYTMLLAANSLWISPLLSRAPYTIKDFAAITLVASSPNILVVHPSVAALSVKELIALAKSRPGALNYASSGSGSGSHLAGELFKSMTGANIVHIPFKGAGPAVSGLLGGQIQIMFASAPSVASNMKSGKLRALAVTGAEPSSLAPGLPTVAASGVPGYEAVQLYAMLAPAKTPAATIRRLSHEIVRVINTPDVREKLFSTGSEVVGGPPERLAAMIASEMARLGKVIKDAGIRDE